MIVWKEAQQPILQPFKLEKGMGYNQLIYCGKDCLFQPMCLLHS